MSDATTSVADLRGLVQRFVEQRDWGQFHNPKNLSMSIAIEAAELMEHFQWLDLESAKDISHLEKDMQQVREEVADVFCYVLSFANALDIDLSQALKDKMIKNAAKYPADQFQGRFR